MNTEEIFSKIFDNEYKKAKTARFDYEVYTGKRSFRGLVELEASLHHIVISHSKIDDNNKLFEIESARNHLQRIAIELTEEVAETLCCVIVDKLDPFSKHPFLCKIMLVHKPDRCDMYWEELRKNQQLIRNGRSLKGEKENFDKCYECFKIALEELWKLNAQIPSSPFWSHLFTLIVSIGSLIIGFLLSLLLKK